MKSVSNISIRLTQWAAWRTRRSDAGLGYPKQPAWANDMSRSGVFGAISPEFSEGCYQVDVCMSALRADDAVLFSVLMLCYVQLNMTVAQKAARLECSVQTYYNKIEIAERRLMDLMNDHAAGVALPSLVDGKRKAVA